MVVISERYGTGSDQNLRGDFQRLTRFESARAACSCSFTNVAALVFTLLFVTTGTPEILFTFSPSPVRPNQVLAIGCFTLSSEPIRCFAVRTNFGFDSNGDEFMIGSSEQAARSFSIWVHIDLIMGGDRDHRFVGGFAAERYHACEGSCAKSTLRESSQVSGLSLLVACRSRSHDSIVLWCV